MTPRSPNTTLDGHGAGRTPLPLILGLVIAALCVLLSLALFAHQPGLGGAKSTVIGVMLALPTAIVLIAVVLFIDRLEPEPPSNLLFAFLWGAGIAALLALLVNTFSRHLLTTPAFGATEGTLLYAAVAAPVVEETVKGAILVGLLWFRRDEIDGPTDGIVYAGMVGIGFALTENVNYYMQGLHAGGTTLIYTFVTRGIVAPLCHPLFTSMIGLGIAYAAGHRGSRRIPAIVVGWVGAIVLHGLWNASSTFHVVGLSVVYFVLLVVLVVLVVVLLRDRKRLIALIAHYLPQYQEVASADDVEMLSTLEDRRLARQWARMTGGMSAAHAMGDYQLAATELALLHRRDENHVIDKAVFDDRRDRLVHQMERARERFVTKQSKSTTPPWSRRDSSRFAERPRHLPGEDLPGDDLPGDHLPGDDLFGGH